MHHVVRAEQLETRVQQKRTEKIEDPIEALNQNGANADHCAAHDERAQNSPEKQAMLVPGVNAKILEDQNEDEYVVHAERFFDYISGKKLEAGATPMGRKNPQSEPNGKRDPQRAFEPRLANRNRVGAAMEKTQVQQQEHRNAGVEGDPQCPGAHLRYARIL